MTDCNCLIHPFQNDPGTSQHQRVMEELLSGAVKIDSRTMADLLDYFVQLSRHINYYDLALNISDWQPFFRNSIPFTLSAIIRYPLPSVEKSFDLYNSLFDKRPTSTGLQLTTWFIYYRFIRKINSWHATVAGSGLPVEATLEALIRNKLQDPVKKFIQYTNAAVKTYGIKRIDFSELSKNAVWNIDQADLYSLDNSFSKGADKFMRINNLQGYFRALFPVFQAALPVLSDAAEKSLESSLIPLKDELQSRHQPHLALLFAFLNIFRQLQDDLNQFTRKHLDFFYKDILKFTAREAAPDRTFIILEIQKHLEKYLLKKGLEVKNGKDDNKQDILFSLDEEIVVNKTQVADTRSLYINNLITPGASFAEGVYMAPDITMADGIDKPFRDDQPKNFPTLGSKASKYIMPRSGVFKPYPNARLGFILASPVLLLNEGLRTVTITLQCRLVNDICEEPVQPEQFAGIEAALKSSYYYINEELIEELIKKGIGSDPIEKLRKQFLTDTKAGCYTSNEIPTYENVIESLVFETWIATNGITLPEDIVKKRQPLGILFSGEKEWIEPEELPDFKFTQLPSLSPNWFELKIVAVLKPDQPAVSFYNKENLKEDFGSTLPLVKIELDDHFKINFPLNGENDESDCCLERDFIGSSIPVSLYHFFRKLKVTQKNGTKKTGIDVKVCGLRNFAVQNDESVLDVNGQVLPFGSRPRIDSNFYIGSQEIFSKKWSDLYINLNWKDFPPVPVSGPFTGDAGKRFQTYYNGYQDVFRNAQFTQGEVEDHKFKVQFSFLFDGEWYDNGIPGCSTPGDLLFQDIPKVIGESFCDISAFTHQYNIKPNIFSMLPAHHTEVLSSLPVKKLDVNTRNYFVRLTLKCQDFQHDKYPVVLGRQLSAFAKLPDLIDGAVYYGTLVGGKILQLSYKELTDAIVLAFGLVDLNIKPKVDDLLTLIVNDWDSPAVIENLWSLILPVITFPPGTPLPSITNIDLYKKVKLLLEILKAQADKIKDFTDKGVIIPKEPWTPVISSISLDYAARADVEEIDMIHLYPFAGTHKHEKIETAVSLFPTFCDEGTLYLGLKSLVPGNNLNILFQLAEATSDSESEKEPVHWHYLDNNIWKLLRTGFEVLEDGTKNLTTSGILQFALPENMTNDNTVMPKGLHWIKATLVKNSKAVSETVGIHTQAIQVTFTNEDANDKQRLAKPLAPGSISKLSVADSAVKSVTQPYESFDGALPEGEGHFYVRVSERLRHKGRAIQAFDYERIVLEAFPVVYRVKCINHSFALDAHRYMNDYPYAPGYVELAVIPDLNRLKAGNSFEPKVPVSIIEEIDTYIRRRTSPFVRFRTMNPRYEKVNFCLSVQLIKGKDENYYREKLRQDIMEFLAPWAIGEYSKLSFGQCVYRSDIIRLLETTDYVDFITDLKMTKENAVPVDEKVRICPDTPRSILVAGEVEVHIDDRECAEWKPYKKCNNETIEPCGNKPEAVIDFCK